MKTCGIHIRVPGESRLAVGSARTDQLVTTITGRLLEQRQHVRADHPGAALWGQVGLAGQIDLVRRHHVVLAIAAVAGQQNASNERG